jgi:hypothetical protein
MAAVGTGHPGEHHPRFGQAVRCDGMESVAVHEDDVAGFAGQFDDAERYAVDDGAVVHVTLYAVAAAWFPQPAQPRMGG